MEEMQVDYNHFFPLLSTNCFCLCGVNFFMVYSSVVEKSKSLRKDVVDWVLLQSIFNV